MKLIEHVHAVGPYRRGLSRRVADKDRCCNCGLSTKNKKHIVCTANDKPGGTLCEKCYSQVPADTPPNCLTWCDILEKKDVCAICTKVAPNLLVAHCCNRLTCSACAIPSTFDHWCMYGLDSIICTQCVPNDALPWLAKTEPWCWLCCDSHKPNSTPACQDTSKSCVPIVDHLLNSRKIVFPDPNHFKSVSPPQAQITSTQLSSLPSIVDVDLLVKTADTQQLPPSVSFEIPSLSQLGPSSGYFHAPLSPQEHIELPRGSAPLAAPSHAASATRISELLAASRSNKRSSQESTNNATTLNSQNSPSHYSSNPISASAAHSIPQHFDCAPAAHIEPQHFDCAIGKGPNTLASDIEAAVSKAMTAHMLPISQTLSHASARSSALEKQVTDLQKVISSLKVSPPRPQPQSTISQQTSSSALNAFTGPFSASGSGLESRLSSIEKTLQLLVPSQHSGPYNKATETDVALLEQADALRRACAPLTAQSLRDCFEDFRVLLLEGFSASIAAACRHNGTNFHHNGYQSQSPYQNSRPLPVTNFHAAPTSRSFDSHADSSRVRWDDDYNAQTSRFNHNEPNYPQSQSKSRNKNFNGRKPSNRGPSQNRW